MLTVDIYTHPWYPVRHPVRLSIYRVSRSDTVSKPIEVTDADFAEEVEKATLPVLVDFWAPWCGPCRMLAPTVEQIAAENEGKLKVAKLNVDDNPQAATRFQVMSIPTLVLFKEGQPIARLVGVQPKTGIMSQVSKYL